jgi:hypothetical protein
MLSRDKLIIDRPLGQPPFLKKERETGGACVPTKDIYIYLLKRNKKNTVRSSRNEKK